MSKKKKVDKPVRRKRSPKKKDDRPQEMTIGEKTFAVGDVGWYVNEHEERIRPKVLQGEITGVYPNDSLEPALGVRDYNGCHRAIRARLCGWTKKEAEENYKAFIKSKTTKKKRKK